MEGSRDVPVFAAYVPSARTAADVEDDSEYNETDNCYDFDDGEDELRFTIASDAE